MTPGHGDLARLERLRARFLGASPGAGAYWESEDDLAAYDRTFAQRIAWKWHAVLAELRELGWTPPPGPLLDWGCGSGVAGRAVVDAFGADAFTRLSVHDASPLAVAFALRRARERFPGLPAAHDEPGAVGTLVVSHVLNELDPLARHDLLETAARSAAVLWVEPGTHADSRTLGAQREVLRASFRVVSPCPHGGPCGMLAPGRERDWCHHFARPPVDAFTSPVWAELSRALGIDLRSLPYSHLVLDRREPPAHPAGSWRILARPAVHKAHAEVLACSDGGVAPRTLAQRADPALHRALDRGRFNPLRPPD